jgi:hypothetical protein
MARIVKVTASVVKDLAEGEEVRDTELKGFGVRRQKEAPSYFLLTRINGRLKRLTIGKHGSPWTAETARKEAARLMVVIRSGGDPARERDERRKVSEKSEVVAERFMESHGAHLKPHTRQQYQGYVDRQLNKAFRGKPISEIAQNDLARAHAKWRATPRAANHALQVMGTLLKWAEDNGYRTSNGVDCWAITRFKERKRERYLAREELERAGTALAAREAAGGEPVSRANPEPET